MVIAIIGVVSGVLGLNLSRALQVQRLNEAATLLQVELRPARRVWPRPPLSSARSVRVSAWK